MFNQTTHEFCEYCKRYKHKEDFKYNKIYNTNVCKECLTITLNTKMFINNKKV